jgi:hypothetical protein
MKHLKKFNETIIDDGRYEVVSGQKRYSNLKYGYIDDSLVIESKPGIKTISFQTGEKGIDISDISKIEDIITFLMTEKDKLI